MSNHWIKLSDSEPIVNKPLLLLTKDGNYHIGYLRVIERVAGREYCQWEIADDTYLVYSAITHWQPLQLPEADFDNSYHCPRENKVFPNDDFCGNRECYTVCEIDVDLCPKLKCNICGLTRTCPYWHFITKKPYGFGETVQE